MAGTLRGEAVVLVANGAGPRCAAEALAAIPREPIRAVVSTGLCGALDPSLRVGSIVCATEIRWSGGAFPLHEAASQRAFVAGPVWSQDRVASTAAEKSELFRRTGAIAVEMEAAGLAPTMRQWGVPLFCVRAVSDEADESFVLDLNAARRSDGRFSAPRVLGQAFAALASGRPLAGISELRCLARQSSIAARALGDFLVDCRF